VVKMGGLFCVSMRGFRVEDLSVWALAREASRGWEALRLFDLNLNLHSYEVLMQASS